MGCDPIMHGLDSAAHLTMLTVSYNQTRLSVAVPAAVWPNYPCLHKGATVRANDTVCVVVGQVKMAREPGLYSRVLFHSIDEDMWVHRVVEPRTPAQQIPNSCREQDIRNTYQGKVAPDRAQNPALPKKHCMHANR